MRKHIIIVVPSNPLAFVESEMMDSIREDYPESMIEVITVEQLAEYLREGT